MSVVDISIHDVKGVKVSRRKRHKGGFYTLDIIITHADDNGEMVETELTLFSDKKENLKVI